MKLFFFIFILFGPRVLFIFETKVKNIIMGYKNINKGVKEDNKNRKRAKDNYT